MTRMEFWLVYFLDCGELSLKTAFTSIHPPTHPAEIPETSFRVRFQSVKRGRFRAWKRVPLSKIVGRPSQ